MAVVQAVGSRLEMPRLPNRLWRAVLSVSEAERVLAQPDLTTALGLRDRAILEVLYSTGLRRMEFVGLDPQDPDAERGVVLVREGKGKNLAGFSTHRLIDFLTALGRDVEIVVKPAPRSRKRGRLHVATA